MADKYKYKDGESVIVEEGDHGLNLMVDGKSLVLRSLPEQGEYHAIFEVRPRNEGDPSPVASRQGNGSNTFNSLHKTNALEFIHFGRSHIYPVEEYPKVAPMWRERLLAEARILARSIQGDQAIAYEFLEGDGSVGAWLSSGIAGAIDFFTKRPIPKPTEYDPLMRRVWQISDKIKAGSAADYELLHDAGLDFMHIRYEQGLITQKVRKRIEELIDAAQIGQKAAEETEGAAFWVLDLYGQATCKEPASLFAYRFGVMMLRAGARGTGSIIADNSVRATFQEVAGVMRTDLPPAATGLILGALRKAFPDPNNMGPVETFAEQLISIQIYVVFAVIDFAIFDLDNLPPDQRARADAVFLEKLAPGLAEQIVNAIAAILLANKLKNLPPNSPVRKPVERVAAVIPAVINSCIREVAKMNQTANAEQRPFSDVFAAEGGWAFIRIIRDAGKALLEAPLKDGMESRHAQDKKYWQALILSIRLQLAPVDSSQVKGQPNPPAIISGQGGPSKSTESDWKSPVSHGKSGANENGDIGIAKLKPVAGEATSIDKSAPQKPTRAKVKKVKQTPKSNRTPTAKEKVEHIGPAYTWAEVEKLFASKQIREDAHLLGVIVRNPQGETIKEWYEVSERDAHLGTAKLLGHTEQKALSRIELMNLDLGSQIIFVGYLQPCNLTHGCSKAMSDFTRRTGLPIDYRHVYGESGSTLHEFNPEDGRITKKERKSWQKNH